MNIKSALTMGACAMALGGCASTYSQSAGDIDPEDFGEANRQTFGAMVVNPNPVYEEPLVTSAERAALAVERYANDQVEQPDGESTTSSVSGGGGGPGG